MRVDRLTRTEIPAAALEWLMQNYLAVDAMNATAYKTFLATDCQLMFGNNPIASGRDAIIRNIQEFWNAIGGLDHSFISVLGSDRYFAAEAVIDYTRKDGKVVSVPCVTIIERNEAGLASFIRIFIDTGPIFL